MVLLDKKIFFGGIAMLIVGGSLLAYLGILVPTGHAGMTEEEILDLMTREQEHQDYSTLAGILFGIGFLLILISFGARRKSKGSPKKEEKKPAE